MLCLYIGGATPASLRAVVNSKKILDEHLPGQYTLEVVDIFQNPKRAKEDQIFAAPTLLKKFPPPTRQIIGDLSDVRRVMQSLDLTPIRGQ